MPVRMGLNIAYALLVEGADAKQRKELDNQLYGWSEMNKRADQDLMGGGGS
jgi:hypothetical protein